MEDSKVKNLRMLDNIWLRLLLPQSPWDRLFLPPLIAETIRPADHRSSQYWRSRHLDSTPQNLAKPES
jgi:hypothetical protein